MQSFDFNLRFLFFVLFSTGGIVLMGYADGFKGVNAVGVIFCAGAAIGAAVYKVHMI